MYKLFAAFLIGLMALAVDVNRSVATADSGIENPASQLVIIEPPANFRQTANDLGFSIGKEFVLAALDLKAITVLIPAAISKESALERLEAQFPGILVDDGEFSEVSVGS